MTMQTIVNKEDVLERTVARCRERGIVIPTFAQLKNPDLISDEVGKRLETVGLQDVDPINLFRINWRNEPREHGGKFNDGNWLEFPSELTGTAARVVGLVGKWFPTGTHKVGAGFGCLVPQLVTGQYDTDHEKAVWPSTGNFCRGGVFDCALLGCKAVAILPQGMSQERFTWLQEMGAEVIATPGSESNVREIFERCTKIARASENCVVFNQFSEFGNSVWHYEVTGAAIERTFNQISKEGDRLAGFAAATGSAGSIAAGDYLRTIQPGIRVAAVEALQCPTMLRCGYGEHRVEGIGDKHVPWIFNVRNTDMVAGVDDGRCVALMRLFNETPGKEFLCGQGIAEGLVERLSWMGISSICNFVAAIKMAKYYEMDERDVVFVLLTDSMEMYGSRMEEQREKEGAYDEGMAARHFGRHLEGIGTDHLRELGYYDRKQIHNLKYFTWVEQQGKTAEELDRLWSRDFWAETFGQATEWDRQIEAFNARVGLAR